MLVRDAMTREVITVGPQDNVVDVGNTLQSRRISGAVVLEDNKVGGMISKESFTTSMRYVGSRPLDSFRVKDFMMESVECAKPDEDLTSVVERMVSSPHRVDRLPVVEDDVLVGILTAGDVTRVFASEVKGKFKVKNLMEYNPQTVYDYTGLDEVIKSITTSTEKRVVVLAGKKVLGVITALDLAMELFNKKKEYMEKNILPLIRIEDVVTLEPTTIEGKRDAGEAAQVMVEKRIGGLPVVDDENLEGMITKTDIVKGYKIYLDWKK